MLLGNLGILGTGNWPAVTTKPSKIVRGQVIRTIGINL